MPWSGDRERVRMVTLDERRTALAHGVEEAVGGETFAHARKIFGRELVDAHDDVIVLDVMKHPKLAENAKAQRMIDALTAFVTVKGIETDSGHLDVLFSAFPRGVAGALAAVRPAL